MYFNNNDNRSYGVGKRGVSDLAVVKYLLKPASWIYHLGLHLWLTLNRNVFAAYKASLDFVWV
jgi:hypothetical protein